MFHVHRSTLKWAAFDVFILHRPYIISYHYHLFCILHASYSEKKVQKMTIQMLGDEIRCVCVSHEILLLRLTFQREGAVPPEETVW